jgi:hypothetical protein
MTILRIIAALISIAVGVGIYTFLSGVSENTVLLIGACAAGTLGSFGIARLLSARRTTRSSRAVGGSPILHRGGTVETASRVVSPPSKPKRVAPAPAAVPSTNLQVPGTFKVGSGESHIEVTTANGENGAVTVNVVAVGYSGSEFKNRVRPRLENVSNIRWQHPKNLGNGKREITGVITGSPAAVLTALSCVNV